MFRRSPIGPEKNITCKIPVLIFAADTLRIRAEQVYNHTLKKSQENDGLVLCKEPKLKQLTI